MVTTDSCCGAVMKFSRSLEPYKEAGGLLGAGFAEMVMNGSITECMPSSHALLFYSDLASDEPPSPTWLFPLAGMLQCCLVRHAEWPDVVDRLTYMLDRMSAELLRLNMSMMSISAVAEAVNVLISSFPICMPDSAALSIAGVVPHTSQRDDLAASMLILGDYFVDRGVDIADKHHIIEGWIGTISSGERSANVVVSVVNSWLGVRGMGPSLYDRREFSLLQRSRELRRDHFRCSRRVLSEVFGPQHMCWLETNFGD